MSRFDDWKSMVSTWDPATVTMVIQHTKWNIEDLQKQLEFLETIQSLDVARAAAPAPAPFKIPRLHPEGVGECMECGFEADPLGIEAMSCMSCGSDQIRIYAEED